MSGVETHDDLVDAIRSAVEQTLRIAGDSPLLTRMPAPAPGHSVSAGGSRG